MKSMNKSALALGVLALGGLVALSAPASAGVEDYDHGAYVAPQVTPWFFDQTANAESNQSHAVNATQAKSQAGVESVAQRRARIAAEMEAKRLQQ